MSPWLLKKFLFNFIISVSHSVLIGCTWNLQIRWTWMKARTSSKTGQMGSLILELHPFDCWKSFFDFVISINYSVLIRSFWNLQIRWTGIQPQIRSKLGQIGLLILELHPFNCWKRPATVAHVDAPSDRRPGSCGFNPCRGRQCSFVEIDHEIHVFSTVILSLPLIQEGQLSVAAERMCTILVNHLED